MLTNRFWNKCDIIKGIKLVHREKSEFQDIRIYDSNFMGRMLVLDGFIQICSGSEDKFSLDLSSPVL